jgi:hypothetical protein
MNGFKQRELIAWYSDPKDAFALIALLGKSENGNCIDKSTSEVFYFEQGSVYYLMEPMTLNDGTTYGIYRVNA